MYKMAVLPVSLFLKGVCMIRETGTCRRSAVCPLPSQGKAVSRPSENAETFCSFAEMFSLKARNVFKKARSLFSFPAEEDEGEGKKPSDGLYGSVQTLGLNRAVVAAELCGRWGRIVRSLRPDRAVDFLY